MLYNKLNQVFIFFKYFCVRLKRVDNGQIPSLSLCTGMSMLVVWSAFSDLFYLMKFF